MFSTMKMGSKILAGFAASVVVMLVVGLVAYLGATTLSAHIDELSDVEFPAYRSVATIKEAQTAVARGINTVVQRRATAEMLQGGHADIDSAFGRIDAALKDFEALEHSKAVGAAWQEVKAPFTEWRSRALRLQSTIQDRTRMLKSGMSKDDPAVLARDEDIFAQYNETRAAFKPAEAPLLAVATLVDQEVEATQKVSQSDASRTITTLLLAILVGAVALLALGAFLGKKIGATVTTLVAEAGKLREAVQAGQLDVRGDLAAVEGSSGPSSRASTRPWTPSSAPSR